MSSDAREERTETIFDGDWYAYREKDAPPLNADRFIEWLRAKLDTIPSEWRASAEVVTVQEVDDYPDRAAFKVTYRRPETEAEYQARIRRDSQWKQDYAVRRLEKLRGVARELGYKLVEGRPS